MKTILDIGAGAETSTSEAVKQRHPELPSYKVDPAANIPRGEGLRAFGSAVDCTIFDEITFTKSYFVDVARLASKCESGSVLLVDVTGDEYCIMLRLANNNLLELFDAVYVNWTKPRQFWHETVRNLTQDYETEAF